MGEVVAMIGDGSKKISNILTEEQKEHIAKSLDEVSELNQSVRVLNQIQNNERTPENGEMVSATIFVDPISGEKNVLNTNELSESQKEFEEKLSEFGDSIDSYDPIDTPIELEDIKEVLNNNQSEAFAKYDLSDSAIIELLEVVKKYKEKGVIKYNELPSEVKVYIDNYLKQQGVAGFTVEANTIRNTITEMMIEEFISNIEMNKFQNEFNSQMENIMDEMNDQISPLFKDYNESRDEYLKNIIEKLNDPNKKELAENIIDSIHDSFALERFKEAAPKIKVKKFDIEKPQKIFTSFVAKYRDNQYKIYDPAMIVNILDDELKKHKLIDENDMTSSIKLVIAFCKFCQNYKPEVPYEHAFMYYFTYNIVLLRVYKKEQYDEYAPVLLKNIKDVLDKLK